MNSTALLNRLQGVSCRGENRWAARCPSHDDRGPSLSIKENDGKLLVHCFAGCQPTEVCASLGLSVSDLFDNTSPRPSRRQTPPVKRPDLRHIALNLELHALALKERAKAVLRVSTCHDAASLSDSDIEAGLQTVSRAHKDNEHVQVLFDVADGLRLRTWKEGR